MKAKWVAVWVVAVLSATLRAGEITPPPQKDPLGFVGTWVEHWPGIRIHDANAITYRDGKYSVEATNPAIGTYRISNVRLEDKTLRFTEHTRAYTIEYELVVRDADTLEAKARGGPSLGEGILWKRQGTEGAAGAPAPKAAAPAAGLPTPGVTPVALGSGDITVVLKWETQGTDVDLLVIDPNGHRCNVLNDVTAGPGQETCIVRNPVQGDYKIEALYCDTNGGKTTPITVDVGVGGKPLGTHKATLQRADERLHIQILRVGGPGPQPAIAGPEPGQKDPLGLVGVWIEYWPGMTQHDVNTVTFGNGQYSVGVVDPATGPYRVDGVRVEGDSLRFTEYPGGTNRIDYWVRRVDPDTCSVRTVGPPSSDAVIWRRQGAAPPPGWVEGRPPPGWVEPRPPQAAGDLVVTMRWDTVGTDVDLFVTDPRGMRHFPLRDILVGPGEETCIVRGPIPGDYRIEARYFNDRGGIVTPVSVEVQFGGRREGPFRATCQRGGDTVLVHTFRVGVGGGVGLPPPPPPVPPRPLGPPPPAAAAVLPPGDITVRLRWDTPGTDVDTTVVDPQGMRLGPEEDILDGPGEEVCTLRNAMPGEYRVEAYYFNDAGRGATPVTVTLEGGGRRAGPFQATLQRRGDRAVVCSFRVGGAPVGPVGPGPVGPGPVAPAADLTITLRWETKGTDVDLLVLDPNGQRCNVLNDVLAGPGQEMCIVRNPAQGDYRVEALYCDTQGGQTTPVTVEVQMGGRQVGTYKAVLQRADDRVLVTTVRVPPAGAPPLVPGPGPGPVAPPVVGPPVPPTPAPGPPLPPLPDPGPKDPLGFVGNWIEYWPGIAVNDVATVSCQNGQYSVQVQSPRTGKYQVSNVRLDDKTLKFSEKTQAYTIEYEVQVLDENTCAVKARGGPRGGEGILWRRVGATGAVPLPPGALSPDLVIVMRWETQDTDVDLCVFDPDGQRCRVVTDVLRGPGQEVCIVQNPTPGEYRIQLIYFNSRGQVTPVTVEVRRGGRLLGVYRAVLQRDGERTVVHTLRL